MVICQYARQECHTLAVDPETGEIIACDHATRHERVPQCTPQYCYVARAAAPCKKIKEGASE